MDPAGAEATIALAQTIARARRNVAERGWGLRFAAAARSASGDRAMAAATLREALAVARAIEEPAARIDLLISLGHAQATIGDDAGVRTTLESALAAAKAIPSDEARAWWLMWTAELQSRFADPGVEDTLRLAISAAAAANDNRLIWLRTFIEAIAGKSGGHGAQLRAAIAVAENFDSFGSFVWNSTPMALVRAPDVAGSIEELVAATRALEGRVSRLILLWHIAQPLVLGGRKDALAVAVREALAVQRKFDPQEDGAILLIAWVQANAGDAAGARATLAAVPARDDDGAYGVTALVQARLGDRAAALTWAHRIGAENSRSQILAWVAAGGPLWWATVGD
jgi:hypothetical protein